MLGHGLAHHAAKVLAIKRLGQELHGEHVVVLVDNQARQQVGFAEDDAVGAGVAGKLFAELHCAVDSLAQKSQKAAFGDYGRRQQPDRDLRGTAVKGRTEFAAALILHMDQCAGGYVASLCEIGAIDPEMSRLKASGSASADRDDWNGLMRRQGALANQACLPILNVWKRTRSGLTVKRLHPAQALLRRLYQPRQRQPWQLWRRPAWVAAECSTRCACSNRRS